MNAGLETKPYLNIQKFETLENFNKVEKIPFPDHFMNTLNFFSLTDILSFDTEKNIAKIRFLIGHFTEPAALI